VYHPSRGVSRIGCTLLAVALALPASGCSKSEPSAPAGPVGPTLTSISPTSGVRGTTVLMTLTGSNFVANSEVASGGGIGATNWTVVNGTTITASVLVLPNAALGNAFVSVTSGSLFSVNLPFTVLPGAPILAIVTPSVGAQGTTVAMTLTGLNFIAGATTVAVIGVGVTTNSVVVTSGSSLTVNFLIAADATPGVDAVRVTTAGGSSGTQSFTVDPAAPLTNLAPKRL
jgi:hypothetical protein